jgi:hypothetical protein
VKQVVQSISNGALTVVEVPQPAPAAAQVAVSVGTAVDGVDACGARGATWSTRACGSSVRRPAQFNAGVVGAVRLDWDVAILLGYQSGSTATRRQGTSPPARGLSSRHRRRTVALGASDPLRPSMALNRP